MESVTAEWSAKQDIDGLRDIPEVGAERTEEMEAGEECWETLSSGHGTAIELTV